MCPIFFTLNNFSENSLNYLKFCTGWLYARICRRGRKDNALCTPIWWALTLIPPQGELYRRKQCTVWRYYKLCVATTPITINQFCTVTSHFLEYLFLNHIFTFMCHKLALFYRLGGSRSLKNADILQNIHMKAQTNKVNPYYIGLWWTFSNKRLKIIIGNDCSKGSTGNRHENKICCHCTCLLSQCCTIYDTTNMWQELLCISLIKINK